LTTAFASDLECIAGGGFEPGDTWSEGLAEQSEFLAVVNHYNETLAKIDALALKRNQEAVLSLASRFVLLHDLHDEPLDPEFPAWLQEIVKKIRLAKSCVCTGLIIGHMKAHRTNPIKLKNLMKTQMANYKKAVFGKSIEDLVHPSLRQAVDQATKLSFSWPAA
jgi:polysaccharide pyruvyl transferase WcaK-like protein